MIDVYGEGLIDLVPQDNTPLSPLVPALGGGPYNVAIATARQGRPVRFHSRLSTDAFGQALRQRLQDEGVDTSGVEEGDEPTTLAVTALAEDGSASFNFYNDATADRLAHPTAPTDPAALAVFGTCSLAWEPAASRYLAVAQEHARNGGIVAVDPNIRPSFATDAHRARLLELCASTTLLKLSADEVDFFGGIDTLRATGVPYIVVTDGGEGLTFYSADQADTVPAYPTTVADTIGAGDTIMGTIVAELDQRGATTADSLTDVPTDTWRDIIRTAAAAAAITCSRTGAQPPTSAELQEFLTAAR